MNTDDLFRGLGVEITLPTSESFLRIRETLTRMGIASTKNNVLYQTCHILHKRGRYAIMHFKELFLLDGKTASISEDDIARRDAIIAMLNNWKLIEVVDKNDVKAIDQNIGLTVLPYKNKSDWQLVSKYTIGNKKKTVAG